jgi:glycosyltransferase involved in cell wall biosynthesis
MSSPQPLVSVVVPAYNHSRYVVQCLRSVFEQDYANIELIVVDDASADDTAALCRAFLGGAKVQARFNHAALIQHGTNQGAHAALNDGIAAARGRYVTFLNSDDYYDPARISACVRAAGNEDRFIFTAVRLVDANGQDALPDDGMTRIQRLLAAPPGVLPSLSFGFLGQQLSVSTGNMFVSRGLLNQAGPFADLLWCHDWDMALRLIRRTEPVYLPEALYFYRYHGTNAHKSLKNTGEQETERVLRGYFRGIKLGQVTNPLAPSPVTWPGVFEMFARTYGVYKWWQAESGAYPRGARVIRPDADLPRIEV